MNSDDYDNLIFTYEKMLTALIGGMDQGELCKKDEKQLDSTEEAE